jgi:hypothetical protein
MQDNLSLAQKLMKSSLIRKYFSYSYCLGFVIVYATSDRISNLRIAAHIAKNSLTGSCTHLYELRLARKNEVAQRAQPPRTLNADGVLSRSLIMNRKQSLNESNIYPRIKRSKGTRIYTLKIRTTTFSLDRYHELEL